MWVYLDPVPELHLLSHTTARKKKNQEEAFSSLNEGSNQPSTIFSDTFLGRRLKIGEPKIMTGVHILEIESSFPSVLLVSILSSCVFFNR